MGGPTSSESGKAGCAWTRVEIAALAFQVVFLIFAASRNADALNTDAVAYLRIAEYYADWRTDLMVSGYWGPLLSWLAVPFLKLGFGPLAAGRAAMVVSGVVFWFGCRAVFRAFEIGRGLRTLGLWLAAVFSVFWSVRHITPDLLLAGLMGMAIARTADRSWLEGRRSAVWAGLLWGLAYYSKAIAFPLAVLVTVAVAALLFVGGMADLRRVVQRAAITWAAFALVAAPWMGVLSVKYGGPTFSTSGRINHAIAGPPDVERYHPFARELHRPDPGRVTQWEDPSNMDYQFWSPFSSAANARHQAGIVLENLPKVAAYFSGLNVVHLLRTGGSVGARDLLALIPGFDLFYLGLAGLIASCVLKGGWRKRLREERWRWTAAPVALMAGLYLPVYLRSDDLRYFYPAFPFVWTACAGALGWAVKAYGEKVGRLEWLGSRALAASFGLPAIVWWLAACAGIPNAGNNYAEVLAERMREAGLSGPIAGSATLQGGRAGLYTAFHLGEAWLGDDQQAGAKEFAEAGAQVVILTVFDPRVEAMVDAEVYTDVTPELFAEKEWGGFPLRVFRYRW